MFEILLQGMKKRIFIKVYGDVIGINFRYYTCQRAEELGVFGYVRNAPDRTVEIEAEGEEDKLKELLAWAHTGPKWGRVDRLEHRWQENRDEFNTFDIRY